MFSRRSWRVLVPLALCSAAILTPFSFSGALQVVNANENGHTIDLSLPGPFNGCTYLDAGATPTTDAVSDLLLPSAFITAANGTLVGQNGPIASAELTSLTPETVRYTIAPNTIWSNGKVFSGADLVSWWQRAKTLASVTSDGYRAIDTLTLSPDGLSVTAVFAHSYSDWDQLFRDVEIPGAAASCAVHNLVTRPSLGAYSVTSATRHRLILNMNPYWKLNPNRFGRVIITDSQSLPASAKATYADYTLALANAQIQAISSHPTLLTRISSSSNIEEVTYAPKGYFTRSKVVREALSWSIARQTLIDKVFGSVTLIPQVAASAIYSQGQSQYPGANGSGLGGQVTTTTSKGGAANGLSDCAVCAVDVLEQGGYTRRGTRWINPSDKELDVRLAVGPSKLDHQVAQQIRADWQLLGVPVALINEDSEIQASQAAATSETDAAVFTRPTLTAPSYAARSWAGPAYASTYPSGVRSPAVTTLFTQASTIFNPVTAASTWLKLDQLIMTNYWVRPLFTAPSLAVYTSTLVTVANSFTEAGFVDQLPTWSIVPPTPTN